MSTGAQKVIPIGEEGVIHEGDEEAGELDDGYQRVTGDDIDGGTANVAVNLAPYSSVQVVARDASDWYRITNLIVYDTSGNRLN